MQFKKYILQFFKPQGIFHCWAFKIVIINSYFSKNDKLFKQSLVGTSAVSMLIKYFCYDEINNINDVSPLPVFKRISINLISWDSKNINNESQ